MSEFELTPEERLSALDPAASASYTPRDMTGMLARITSQPRVPRVRIADGFRVRVGTAVAAAALLTTGGIAVIQSAAPSLSVLVLGAAHNSTATTDKQSPASALMRLAMNYHFIPGSALSSEATSNQIFTLSAPSDFAALSQQIASVFSISGQPSDTPAANSYWTIGDTSGNYVSFWSDGTVLNWSYNSSAFNGSVTVSSPPAGTGTTVPGTPDTVPSTTDTVAASPALSNDRALSYATALLSQLGVTDTLGTATYSNEGPFTDGTSWTDVTIPLDMAGVDTGFLFTFTFANDGTLVSANGVSVTVTAGDSYPLLSEVAAVAVLQSQQNSFYGGPILYSPITTPTTLGSANSSGGASGATSTTTATGSTPVSVPDTTLGTTPDTTPGTTVGSTPDTTPSSTPGTTPVTEPTLPVVDVTLDSVSIQYALYTLSGGAEVLLPQYVYTGNVNGSSSTFTVLAVDPAYVQLATPSGVRPMIY